jgi:hypothetical protein
MNNLRDLLGYLLDAIDVHLVRHRSYAYCGFVSSVFSDEDTAVSRFCERFYKEVR